MELVLKLAPTVKALKKRGSALAAGRRADSLARIELRSRKKWSGKVS